MKSAINIRFTRSCPTCGRRIEIRASLLGRTVGCPHCGAEFTANSSEDPVVHFDESNRLMDRVERVLEGTNGGARDVLA